METPAIVITDAVPRVDDPRCPRCRAEESARVLSAGFGDPHEVCGQCGYEFPAEDVRG